LEVTEEPMGGSQCIYLAVMKTSMCKEIVSVEMVLNIQRLKRRDMQLWTQSDKLTNTVKETNRTRENDIRVGANLEIIVLLSLLIADCLDIETKLFVRTPDPMTQAPASAPGTGEFSLFCRRRCLYSITGIQQSRLTDIVILWKLNLIQTPPSCFLSFFLCLTHTHIHADIHTYIPIYTYIGMYLN